MNPCDECGEPVRIRKRCRCNLLLCAPCWRREGFGNAGVRTGIYHQLCRARKTLEKLRRAILAQAKG